MLFDQFKKDIYDPLGYKVFRDYNFSNIIQKMVHLTKDEAMIHPETSIPDRNAFIDEQLHKYDQMQDLAYDFNKNKEIISHNIMDSLKRFHIYWNVERQRNELKNMHSTTLSFIRRML